MYDINIEYKIYIILKPSIRCVHGSFQSHGSFQVYKQLVTIKAHVHSKIAYAQNSMKVCENIYYGSFYDFTTYFFSKE